MRLIFVSWLVVILYALSRLPMAFRSGDISGWLAQSVGFAVVALAPYYIIKWVRKRRSTSRLTTPS